MPKSFSPQVHTVSCRPGDYTGNALRFATREESDAYAVDLGYRWTAVESTRTIETDDPVNYVWSFETGRARPIETTS